MPQPRSLHRILAITILFELGLAATALLVGWLAGHWPAIGMSWASRTGVDATAGILWGIVGTLPLILALLVMDRFPIGPINRVRQIAAEMLGRLFRGANVWQLAAVAMAAGLGEELLFRGLLQSGLAKLIGPPAGPWVGLVVAAVIFGCCHWLNATYAVLAVIAGLYFGWLLMATGSLWTPIIAHALYDFIAMIYLARSNHLLDSSVDL